MKKIIFILLYLISLNAYSQSCPGISGTGTTKVKTTVSCYDTVKVTSYLNTVIADTLTATKITSVGPISASNITGTNTGDQTTISGNAATATKLATPITINGTSFDGSANITISAAPSGTAGGDLSSTYPNPTVSKINGTSLSGLATGILKNTNGTGVPSIAVAADFPTLNQNTTGTSNTIVSAPDYFYTGSTFYKSRIGITYNSNFYNTIGATNVPTNIIMIGDSRMSYFPIGILESIGQYNKINSLGFVQFYSNIYGSEISFVNTGTAATITRNDSTTASNWGICGTRADAGSGAIYTITPVAKYRFDSFQLWYNKTSGGGSFTYNIDGAGAVTVNTSAISDSLGTLTINTGLASSGTHTIVLTVTSGSVRFYGIDFYNKAQSGFVVHILQSGGSKASQWSASATNLYTKQFIAAKNPVLCTFWLGVNDAGDAGVGSSSSTYISNLKNLIKNINLPVKCSPVIITDIPRGLTASPTSPDINANTLLSTYRDKIIQAVTDSGYSAFDLSNYWPSFSYAQANTMYSDAVHPSLQAAMYVWSGLVRPLMPVFYNENMSGLTTFRKGSILVPGDGLTGFGVVQQASNGIQTEAFTGHYFDAAGSTNTMSYKLGGTKYITYNLSSAIATMYPTSTYSQVLFGYRQGSTSNKAFDLSVNSDNSISLSTNNSPVNFTVTKIGISSKLYISSIATMPTALLHLGAGTSTASTACFKMTRGALLTTAEQGAWGYGLNGRLFFSPSTTWKNIPVSDTGSASNGKILIGNGTDYTVANITQGINTIVTNGSGSIVIDVDTSNGSTKLATQGDITRAIYRGTVSQVGTATSTFTVTIGATMANTNYRIPAPGALNVLSAAVCYINNKTTTTFDVVYLTGLTGTVAFDWILVP